jgi:glycogen operon protein
MLQAGDEIGRTQGGNNNAYCRDDEVSWLDWDGADRRLLAFVQRLTRLRRGHEAFRRSRFGDAVSDGVPVGPGVGWFTPSGAPMDASAWADDSAHALTLFLDGSRLPNLRSDGTREVDDSFLLFLNAYWETLAFQLPGDATLPRDGWSVELDTSEDIAPAPEPIVGTRAVAGRSLVLVRRPMG